MCSCLISQLSFSTLEAPDWLSHFSILKIVSTLGGEPVEEIKDVKLGNTVRDQGGRKKKREKRGGKGGKGRGKKGKREEKKEKKNEERKGSEK